MRRRFAICKGVTRAVALVGNYAVKVPRFSPGSRGCMWSLAQGYLANLSEREWSGQPGLCPVLWSLGGLVNVYPRCEPVPADVEIDYRAITGMNLPSDDKPHNVGLLNGALVWVDYDMNWNDCGRCNLPVVPIGRAS
jgi:hypothetical protein